MSKIYRQGDVLIIRDDDATIKGRVRIARDAGRIVLAYGEQTGHAHAIASRDATLYAPERPKNDPEIEAVVSAAVGILVARRAVALQHEEHRTITLPKGRYVVRRQREYSPQELRLVAD